MPMATASVCDSPEVFNRAARVESLLTGQAETCAASASPVKHSRGFLIGGSVRACEGINTGQAATGRTGGSIKSAAWANPRARCGSDAESLGIKPEATDDSRRVSLKGPSGKPERNTQGCSGFSLRSLLLPLGIYE